MYFFVIIAFSMIFMHPICIAISLICAVFYSIYLNGMRAVKFICLYMLPLFLIFVIFNAAVNHAGVSIILYVNDNPITRESIFYGIAAASTFVSVMIWFSCFNTIMTSDKFTYLFGRIIPVLSLIFSMVLRTVPRLKAQAKIISNSQKCIGRDVSNGNIFSRIKNGIKIMSILITWAFENALETADSMKSRGYGLKGRTSFSNYRFDNRDMISLVLILICTITIIILSALGINKVVYFPAIYMRPITVHSNILFGSYLLLGMFPLIFNLVENIKWIYIRSKI